MFVMSNLGEAPRESGARYGAGKMAGWAGWVGGPVEGRESDCFWHTVCTPVIHSAIWTALFRCGSRLLLALCQFLFILPTHLGGFEGGWGCVLLYLQREGGLRARQGRRAE